MTKKDPNKKKKTKSIPKTAAVKPDKTAPLKAPADKFPVVGLGASAGGLDALKSFFSTPSDFSLMSYIVVVHMTPKQPSMLAELLQKIAAIPVATIKDGQALQPGRIYVNPPDKEISIYKGRIHLLDLVKNGAVSHPIDLFLRSLAQDQGNRAAAVILSGTGTDGTMGIKAIKAKEGLILAQSEESSAYDGMPRSAISTGLVDMVLPPQEMPEKLIQYFRRVVIPKIPSSAAAIPGINDPQEWLHKIFAILRAQIGYDFSAYKVNTIWRRINRRMGLNQIDSYEKYIRLLRQSPREIESLFRELLIGVTSFFRDAESFDAIKNNILPTIFEAIREGDTFRAWLPGCSTGEEAYSMAMILHECLDNTSKRIGLQLFGTDIDKYAIQKAREGLFPISIASDVTSQRLRRFFVKEGDYYRIRREIRDCVVFSVQDVINDPPFSHLNLLCCRNLLIYLNNKAQKRLLPLFHYTLVPDGVLILGSSETIGGFTSLFEALDKKWKIFRCREVPQSLRQMVDFPSGPSNLESGPLLPVNPRLNISQVTQKIILDQFAPTAVLTDTTGEILHIQGRSGKYLEPPSGPPTRNILDLAREGLRIELSAAIRAAGSSNQPIIHPGIKVKTNGGMQIINLHVTRQHSPKEIAGHLLVVFKDVDSQLISSDSKQGIQQDQIVESCKITDLEKELQDTRESHQTTVEELESSNEELKSTNEELQSANEELQSTNEELESSKEELQSLNEELQTVNAELQSKVEELSSAQDDMRNLMDSTEIATIFVDNDLRVRRFTPKATTIVNLIRTDIGRPLKHVVTNLAYDAMISDVDEVLKKLTPKEIEVQTKDGLWFTMRILPYRTTDNRIDGAVLTFSSIMEQKKIQNLLQSSKLKMKHAWETVRAIFDLNSDPMVVIDENGKMVIANTSFSDTFGIAQTNLEKITVKDLNGLLPGQINLDALMQSNLETGKDFTTSAFKLNLSNQTQTYSISGRCILKNQDYPYHILLQFIPQKRDPKAMTESI